MSVVTVENDGWLLLIRTLQHPELCSRYMLVEDDMLRAGLGFTGRLLASALLLAIRSGRVSLIGYVVLGLTVSTGGRL